MGLHSTSAGLRNVGAYKPTDAAVCPGKKKKKKKKTFIEFCRRENFQDVY
jgi:hypothetical protein